MRDKNNDVSDRIRADAGSGFSTLDTVGATAVFDDPITYLARLGIEASMVAESVDRLRHAA